jgi:hypothetical protein
MNVSIHSIEHDGEQLYLAQDLAKALGISNFHTSLATVPKSSKCLLPYQTRGGIQNVVFLKKDAVICILTKTRKRNVMHISSYLGFDLYNVYVPCLERKLLDAIHEVFPKIFIEQYPILVDGSWYKIDAYSTKYCLAIECDESYASHHTISYDTKRQAKITSILKCSWVRCKSSPDDIGILRTIRDIHTAILNTIDEQ